MMQGDAYSILITDDGVDLDKVSEIEFTVGNLTKMYPDVVTYDETNKAFAFPISQAESLKMLGKYDCSARIKYTDGQVEGMPLGMLNVEPGASRSVI